MPLLGRLRKFDTRLGQPAKYRHRTSEIDHKGAFIMVLKCSHSNRQVDDWNQG